MGGYLALRMYDRAPELCAGLVLADTKAGADDNAGKVKRADAIKAAAKSRDEFIEGQIKALLSETSRKNADLVQHVRSLMQKTDGHGITAGLVALATRTDSTALLEKVSVPTQIIVGADDAITPLTEAEKLHQGIPSQFRSNQVAVIKGAGHLSNLETPDEFNQILKMFLAR